MKLRYKASMALENFILNKAPKHHPDPNAPNGFEELMEWYRTNRAPTDYGDSMPSIPVFSGSSDKTIFSNDRYNFAARAWHDSIHISERLNFSMADEIQVMNHQIRQMKASAVMYGLTNEDYQAIKYDVGGQVLYWNKHKRYVNDQSAFVQACFNDGMIDVVASGVLY